MKTFLRWLLRHAVLYLALVLAIAIAPLVAQAWKSASAQERTFLDLSSVEVRLRTQYGTLSQEFTAATADLEGRSVAQIDARIARRRAERAEQASRLAAGGGVMALYRQGPQVLLANQRARLQIAVLDREIATLEAARLLADRRDGETRHRARTLRLQQAEAACRLATARLQALDRQWTYRWRNWVESPQHKALAAVRDRDCRTRDDARRALAATNYVEGGVVQAQAAFQASRRDLARSLDGALAQLMRERAEAQTRWNGTARQKLQLWAEQWHLTRLLWQALWALLAILALPWLIRALFWTVLAPLAERRAAIRLAVPGGRGATIAPAARSATSVPVRLAAGEELLVRQSYLQTTSHVGAKATQWLLDWRHPLASAVSGLTFLTRIRGAGETTTVSAVRDPFAEVTVIILPDGASCVLQPRALAAVVQPQARPLRITSHWRLASLNAWLTLQLRYLVFHGPCRLVVKGGRGVRVERAEQGRVFGQDQLVGFSADLAYSVSRTETFWPYLFGYEPLFKDKVETGEGVLVVEEAPMAGRGRGEARHGLEGAFDVMTRALGL